MKSTTSFPLHCLSQTTCNLEPVCEAKIREFNIVYTQAVFLAVCELLLVAVTVVDHHIKAFT